MRIPIAIAVSSWVTVVAVMPAVAEPTAAEQARALGERAVAAASTGDFAGAIGLFKEARTVDDRAEYVCNIGLAYRGLGDLPRAYLFLSECLVRAGAMEPAAAAGFRGVLDEVEATLRAGAFAPVDVTVTPRGAEVTAAIFADDESAPGPRLLWLPVGPQVVRARAPGYHPAAAHVEVTAGRARQAVSLTLEALPPPQPPPLPPRDEAPAAMDPLRRSRTPAWIGFGAGGVAIAAGAYFHVQAMGTRDEIAADHPFESPARDELETTWRRQVTGMYVGYGVGAAALAVGGYLWWRSGRDPGAPVVAPGGTDRVTVTWTF